MHSVVEMLSKRLLTLKLIVVQHHLQVGKLKALHSSVDYGRFSQE